MTRYRIDARHASQAHPTAVLDEHTMGRLWDLFVAIGVYWQTVDQPERMRSNLWVFVANRIEVDLNYLAEYRNAAAVLDELIAELGQAQAYQKLFTDPQANISPPSTRLARARQKVSNEFISLQLALGGFKAFGAVNYLGYIGGPNIEGQLPYRPLVKVAP